MDPNKIELVKTLWREILKHTTENGFALELDIHKKLLSIFHVGRFYYYIFNCLNASMEFISDSMCNLLGHPKSHFRVENLAELIHPDDFIYFIEFEKKVTNFFTQLPPALVTSYKVSYDYRMRKADGGYIRILHQATAIHTDSNGAVLRVLGVHTDISQLKKTNGSTLSFIGLNGQPSFENVMEVQVSCRPNQSLLSNREKQILQHLLQGMTSAQIGFTLHISKATVDRHRKNMLKKTNSKSTAELSIRSIRENWF